MGSRLDRATASAAIGGDPAALRELWRANRRWVAAVLLSHMPSDAELDDLLQDVALTVVERIGEVRNPERLRGWLRTVAVNAARTAGRRTSVRRRAFQATTDHAPEPVDGSAERGVRSDEAKRQAKRVLELAMRLHPDYREPLLLKAVRGMSQKAIAETLGLPETTVETRLARARRMLREEMAFEDELEDMPIARRRIRS